jgi:tRNA 2-thiouridine synthesizing protein B
MLHIVNQAPQAGNALTDCLRICDANAAILLIEDGVYAALASGSWLVRIQERTRNLYVLEADVAARGLAGRITGSARVVDYAGFVALCCEYPGTYSWY